VVKAQQLLAQGSSHIEEDHAPQMADRNPKPRFTRRRAPLCRHFRHASRHVTAAVAAFHVDIFSRAALLPFTRRLLSRHFCPGSRHCYVTSLFAATAYHLLCRATSTPPTLCF